MLTVRAVGSKANLLMNNARLFSGVVPITGLPKEPPIVSSPNTMAVGYYKPLSLTPSVKPRFGISFDTNERDHSIDHYLVGPDTNPDLWEDQKLIEGLAKEEGLNFFPQQFWNMDRDTLLQATARSGFFSRYRHWSFGQQFDDLYLSQRHGLSHLYELVINNDPCYAYLLRENPRYAQRAVIAHVYGHNDFFKNNKMFSQTHRNMINKMAAHATNMDNIRLENNVSEVRMEKFLDKVHSLQWCIDMDALSPKELNLNPQPAQPKPVGNDYGRVRTDGLGEHMDRYLNPPEEVDRIQQEERDRREEKSSQFPHMPDSDVLGFIIEHSPSLKPWQKDVLSMVREESYYFVPQVKTKIMNEGWATRWHRQLMLKRPETRDPEHLIELLDMIASVEAPRGFNPYALGRAIYDDIENRWNKGQHGTQWDSIVDRDTKESYDDKSMKGKEKIFEVRKFYNDYSFIDEFLTPKVVRDLKMYQTRAVGEVDPSQMPKANQVIISSREFQDIKKSILGMLENGGMPKIKVINGNHNNRGELLLRHDHSYDLKPDWAQETLKNTAALWGRPVHLDTRITKKQTVPQPQRQFVGGQWITVGPMPEPPPPEYLNLRYTVEISTKTEAGTSGKKINTYTLKRFELDDDGKVKRELDNNNLTFSESVDRRKTWEEEAP